MAMVFSVCPGCFRTAQTLAVGVDKPGSTISVTDYDKISGMNPRRRSSPLDLNNRHVVKGIFHILFHLLHVPCLWAAPIDQLRSSPVLLNKIQLAVILGIEITDVTPRGDVLLQVRLLVLEIGLCE
jgi:hypothetical protein